MSQVNSVDILSEEEMMVPYLNMMSNVGGIVNQEIAAVSANSISPNVPFLT